MNFASDPYDGELWKKIYYKLPLGITKQETERAIAYNYGDDMLPIPDFLSTAVFLNDKKRARAKRVWEDIRRISEQDTEYSPNGHAPASAKPISAKSPAVTNEQKYSLLKIFFIFPPI